MDKDALLNTIKALSGNQGIDAKEQREMLMLLYELLEKRDRTRMNNFARWGYERVKKGQQIPDEWIEFAFERLDEAARTAFNEEDPKVRARNVAKAVFLSGRKDAETLHLKTVILGLSGFRNDNLQYFQ
jgi:hypothetical protein